jgi:hypothetical protein
MLCSLRTMNSMPDLSADFGSAHAIKSITSLLMVYTSWQSNASFIHLCFSTSIRHPICTSS